MLENANAPQGSWSSFEHGVKRLPNQFVCDQKWCDVMENKQERSRLFNESLYYYEHRQKVSAAEKTDGNCHVLPIAVGKC